MLNCFIWIPWETGLCCKRLATKVNKKRKVTWDQYRTLKCVFCHPEDKEWLGTSKHNAEVKKLVCTSFRFQCLNQVKKYGRLTEKNKNKKIQHQRKWIVKSSVLQREHEFTNQNLRTGRKDWDQKHYPWGHCGFEESNHVNKRTEQAERL